MSWRCPYCQQIATLLDRNISEDNHLFNKGNKDGNLGLQTKVVICPNSKCKEYTINATLRNYEERGVSKVFVGDALGSWKLRPASSAKPLPSYIPKPIQDDYNEACLIADLSPKASATLSRRCLQGMIRDFHGIVKDRLVDEIAALKPVVDGQTWKAIDSVRNVGNIGAHMEKDINTIVEVDPDEAQLLIKLIETLIDEWYVHRHDRDAEMKAIIAMAQEKKEDKSKREDSTA